MPNIWHSPLCFLFQASYSSSISTSFTFLNKSEANTRSFSFWLCELMTVSLFPCHSFFPSQMNMMFSPMPITEFMSWVLMMVAM